MEIFSDIPLSQVDAQKRHLYGSIINLLYLKEDNSPFLDATIQTIINEVIGLNDLFGYQAEILSIVANLETARNFPDQFRKCILNAANLVNVLNGGDMHV